MQRLEVSVAVRPIYGSLGVKRLTVNGCDLFYARVDWIEVAGELFSDRFIFSGCFNRTQSFVIELKKEMHHWMYFLHANSSDCQHDCRMSSDRLRHSGR